MRICFGDQSSEWVRLNEIQLSKSIFESLIGFSDVMDDYKAVFRAAKANRAAGQQVGVCCVSRLLSLD